MTIDFDSRVFEEHAKVCKVLANPKRLMILYLLSKGEQTVSAIAKALGVPMANISQHLAKLRERGLVSARKEGQTVIYSITDERIPKVCDLIRGTLLEQLRSQANLIRSIQDLEPMGHEAQSQINITMKEAKYER